MENYYMTEKTKSLMREGKQQNQNSVPNSYSGKIHSIYNDPDKLHHNNSSSTKKPVKLRVCYSVGDTNSDRHCFGINSLAYDRQSNRIYSSGRDSSIKSWSINYKNTSINTESSDGITVDNDEKDEFLIKDSNFSSVKYLKSYNDHTDWVNDIFIENRNNLLVSCSSDNSIKIWDTSDESEYENSLVRNVVQHEDFVKVLAYAPDPKHFVSSGLDSFIVVWDLNVCCKTTVLGDTSKSNGDVLNSNQTTKNNQHDNSYSYASDKNSIIVDKFGDEKMSTYSLAINNDATKVFTGSIDQVVKVWDVKSGQKISKLKGHTDNIRSIVLDDDNRRCLTASSDGTVRLWDLGTSNCIHVFDDIHNDSVWTLARDPKFNYFYSGGRDGEIYKTDISTFESILITKEPSPILKILNNQDHDDSIWFSTSDSDIKNYRITSNDKDDDRLDRIVNIKEESTFEEEEEQNLSNLLTSKKSKHFTTTTNNTRNSQPIIKENYVIKGRPGIIQYHILNNRIQILTRDTSDNVELWDISKGIKLESFGKVNYDKKVEELSEILSISKWCNIDLKTGSIYVSLESPQCFQADCYPENIGITNPNEIFNIGENIILSLFSNWLFERKKLIQLQKQQVKQQSNSNSTNNNNNSNTTVTKLSSYFKLPESTEILIFDNNNHIKHRCKINEFKGDEQVSEIIPHWVYEYLVDADNLQNNISNQNQQKRQLALLKVAFYPCSDKSNLQPTSGTVISNYSIKKISSLLANRQKLDTNGVPPEEFLEILCNSNPVPINYTILTVKSFLWKNPDKEFTLQYRIKPKYLKQPKNNNNTSTVKITNNNDSDDNSYTPINNHNSMIYDM